MCSHLFLRSTSDMRIWARRVYRSHRRSMKPLWIKRKDGKICEDLRRYLLGHGPLRLPGSDREGAVPGRDLQNGPSGRFIAQGKKTSVTAWLLLRLLQSPYSSWNCPTCPTYEKHTDQIHDSWPHAFDMHPGWTPPMAKAISKCELKYWKSKKALTATLLKPLHYYYYYALTIALLSNLALGIILQFLRKFKTKENTTGFLLNLKSRCWVREWGCARNMLLVTLQSCNLSCTDRVRYGRTCCLHHLPLQLLSTSQFSKPWAL